MRTAKNRHNSAENQVKNSLEMFCWSEYQWKFSYVANVFLSKDIHQKHSSYVCDREAGISRFLKRSRAYTTLSSHQTRSQVLRFGGAKYIFRGKDFFYYGHNKILGSLPPNAPLATGLGCHHQKQETLEDADAEVSVAMYRTNHITVLTDLSVQNGVLLERDNFTGEM